MNANKSSQFSSQLCGPVKIIIFVLILLIGSLIVFVTSRYLDPSDLGGYLAYRAEDTVNLIRYSVLIHATISFLVLLLASVLVFFRIEQKFPRTHRTIGRLIVFSTLLFLVPTGFVLSYHALGGISGKILFSLLTLLSMIFIAQGFYTALKRKLHQHRKWMLRFYIVLSSAVWLRINLFICFQVKWIISENDYLWCAILSWVPQLIILEFYFWWKDKKRTE